MTRTKKPKPSFDVARDPVGETRSGWVFRSEPVVAPSADATPAAVEGPPERRIVTGELLPPTEYIREPRFQPSAPPAAPARNWVSTGLFLMVLPVTVGMSIMLAPVNWFFGSRPRR